MRRAVIATLLVVLASTSAALADKPITAAKSAGTTQVAAKLVPPARPVALTVAQYQALQSLQATPAHSCILGTSATYSAREKSLKFTRFSDDIWTVVYDVGWPGAYLAALLCAL